MASKLPVIAVVPAHNNANTLPELLSELIKQKYDDIYVIDDASTDNTVNVVKKYRSKVKLIENSENVGAGANRNRIIGQAEKAILHFIDADMRLLSKNTPRIIRNLRWPKNAAYIGGMVRNPDGTQNPFNYGPRPHILTGHFQGGLQYIIWSIGRLNQRLGAFLHNLFRPLLRGLPNIHGRPRPKRVHWVAESNMLVKSDFFGKHGGFDPRFKYSEIVDLALRLHRRGYCGYFNPRIDAIHATTDNIFRRKTERYQAHKEFIKKHGRLAYYLPPLSDHLSARKTQKRYHK